MSNSDPPAEPSSTSSPSSGEQYRERLAPFVVLALVTAGCWAGWMGWDVHYDTDPVTGAASGPYQPWQVIGCLACLVLVAVLATRRCAAGSVAATMTVSFTVAWSVSATVLDDQGLWPVGAVLVFVGMAVGSTLVAFVSGSCWRAGEP